MKLIHLSDLHLGKRLSDYSLIDDQKYILDKILSAIKTFTPVDGRLNEYKIGNKNTIYENTSS